MECGTAHYPPLIQEGAASGWNPTLMALFGCGWSWGRQKPCRKIKQLHVISWLCTEHWECRNSHGILAEALGWEKKGV